MFQLPDRFRLHDALRRRICMAAFLALCVAPTVAVLAWGVWRRLPWEARWEVSRLSGELGLRVSVEKVRHPRPGLAIYEGVVLTDPETGAALFRCRLVEAVRRRPADPKGPQAASLAISVREAEIEAAGLEHFIKLIRQGLKRQTGFADLELRLDAGEVRLRSAQATRRLVGVQGFLRPVAGGSHGEISFRLATIQTTEPVRIRVGRDRGQTPPRTGMELYTGGGVLPCSLLALGFPGLERLGPSSGFRGYLWVNEKPEGWACELTGQLTGIELDSLPPDCCPHKLTGTAQVNVEVARLVRGRLVEAAGSVRAGPGMVSRSLLDASVESLGLARGAESRSPGSLVPYEQLALSFQIDERGLRLRGLCPVPGLGTVLVDRTSRLLAEPEPGTGPIPVGALVRAIAPAGHVQVPATRASDWLMSVLPLPEGSPAHGPETAVSARVGLGEPFERR